MSWAGARAAIVDALKAKALSYTGGGFGTKLRYVPDASEGTVVTTRGFFLETSSIREASNCSGVALGRIVVVYANGENREALDLAFASDAQDLQDTIGGLVDSNIDVLGAPDLGPLTTERIPADDGGEFAETLFRVEYTL